MAKFVNPQVTVWGRMAFVIVICASLWIAAQNLELPLFARQAMEVGVLVALAAIAVHGIRSSVAHFIRLKTTYAVAEIVKFDTVPAIVTNEEGVICTRNLSAVEVFSKSRSDTLSATLRAIIANPGAVLFRLQARAKNAPRAQEDLALRSAHLRLSAQYIAKDQILWRIETLPPASPGRRADPLPIPMVTISKSGTVLFMNPAAREFVGDRIKSSTALFGHRNPCDKEIAMVATQSGQRRALILRKQVASGRTEYFFVPMAETGVAEANSIVEPPVPLLRISVDGKIVTANALAVELMGPDCRIGVDISHVMEGLGRPISDWLADTLSGKATQRTEFLRLKRSDREVFVQVTLSRLDAEGGPCALAVLNDATELKSLEAQFVQSQKMQAIGQLAGGVAHDFNNLLTAITGHCDLLLLRHDQGDHDFGDLTQINENANRAAALVSQLLAFSRKQTLQPETLDLRDTLADLTHLLNRLVGEKIVLTLAHDPVLKPIRADKRQIEQVLMNLVLNARDAMSGGGNIRIDTEVVSLITPLTRDRATVPAGEYVSVRVIDEGTGIDADKLPKIFEPFYTTKRTGEGTGLGLSTAYGIVKQSGGFIFADSVKENGTEFTLYFPVQAVELPAAKPTPAKGRKFETLSGTAVVLLVEDEAPVRAFASRALRLRGFTVIEADCGEEVLNRLEDKDLSIDVIVTDVVMPGLDGPTWVRRALQDRPGLRVVFVSGYAEGSFGGTPPDLPHSVFLPKPFSLNQLTETVHLQLAS